MFRLRRLVSFMFVVIAIMFSICCALTLFAVLVCLVLLVLLSLCLLSLCLLFNLLKSGLRLRCSLFCSFKFRSFSCYCLIQRIKRCLSFYGILFGKIFFLLSSSFSVKSLLHFVNGALFIVVCLLFCSSVVCAVCAFVLASSS